MIYLDNIIFSLQRAGGISVVWQNLIENLLDFSTDIGFIEYQTASDNIFRQKLDIDQRHIRMMKGFSPIFSQFKSPVVAAEEPFIFHSSYFRTCRNPHAINVTTVHDFIYEQGQPTLKQKLRIALNYKAIRKSDAIVCISENTKKDLFRFVPEIEPDKVHVIYNGVSEDYFRLPTIPYQEYSDCVMYVGGRQGYKNFDFVVRALKDTRYRLVICGSPLSDVEKALLEKNLSGRYLMVQFPSNQELNKIYNSVHCLAYTSSYEGFGLPVLEAQRAGCPVVALESSSIPEVIGDEALLMPELSEETFVSLLTKIEDPIQRQLVVDSGLKNSKLFSWQKMAEGYMELYNHLLNAKFA